MTASLVGAAATATSAAGHDLSLTADASTANGDFLLAAVVSRAGNNTIAAPDATWTLVPNSQVHTGTTSGQITAAAFTRPASAADAGASFDFTSNTSSVLIAGVIATLRGIDATTPIDVAIGVASSASSNIANPGCTTVTDGCLVVAIDLVNSDASGNLTVSSPFTEQAEAHTPAGTANPVGAEIATWAQTTHGATGTVTWASDAGANKSINYVIAFRPAAGGSSAASVSPPAGAATAAATTPSVAAGAAIALVAAAAIAAMVTPAVSSGVNIAVPAAAAVAAATGPGLAAAAHLSLPAGAATAAATGPGVASGALLTIPAAAATAAATAPDIQAADSTVVAPPAASATAAATPPRISGYAAIRPPAASAAAAATAPTISFGVNLRVPACAAVAAATPPAVPSLPAASTEPPETALALASSPLAAQALTLERGVTVRHGVDVLDLTDTPTGEALPFTTGSVTWSYRPPDPLDGQQNAVTAVRRQATLTVPGDVTLNLLTRRFRLWTEFLLADGRWARWHRGVFASTVPKLDDDGTLLTRTLSLADKSYLWSQTKLTDPVHLDDTEAAIPWVIADLGTRFGETRFAISGDQTATVGGNGLTFDADTDLLTLYSTVLAAVGLDALTTDENGIPSSQPLTTLAGKGISATYGAGARKIVPAGSVDSLIPNLPNVIRFVARQGPSSGGSEGNGIYTVRNQSTGPGSIDARGGVEVSLTVQVDAVDQDTLQAIGDANKQRYFAGGGQTFSGSIGLNPTLGDQDVISILLPRLGLTDPGPWLVTSWTYPLQPITDPSAVLMPITAEMRVP